MRLLIADKLDFTVFTELELLGVRVDYMPELTADDLNGALQDINILVVRSTRVSAEAIASAPGLNLIVRAGAGVNTIDVTAACDRGVYVANCPGRNAAAVAELTMAHVLARDRRLGDATVALRGGRWEKSAFQAARGVLGRRFAVAGLGAIGRLVLERARGFGCELYAWSRSLSSVQARELGVTPIASLRDLAATADIFTCHLPLTSSTRGIISREVLEALRDGVIFVNTARAEIVDQVALAEVAAAKNLKVGLDVFEGEPKRGKADFRPTILDDAMVYGTPHIGASTEQAQEAIANEACRIVRCFLTSEEVPNVVNICSNTPARFAVVLRALDEVGVLANVLGVMKRHGLNVEECTNTVFDGARAACTKLRISGRPSEACLAEIRAFEEVFHVDVIALPNLA